MKRDTNMTPSNKTLTYLLITFIIISIGGIITSLAQLYTHTTTKALPSTGQAITSNGNVSISITSTLSITTIDDDTINFSSCSPGRVIYSNITGGNTHNDCPYFTADEILIRNDGNIEANVSINFSNWGEAHGGTFINSTTNNSWIAYKITNSSSNNSYEGGCMGNYQSTLLNVTSTNAHNLLGCDHLQADGTYNSFELDIAIYIPETTTTGSDELTITFIANNVI